MKNTILKTCFLSTMAAMSTLIICQTALATAKHGPQFICHYRGKFEHHGKGKHFNRHITLKEARLLTQAKLIMRGKKHLKVGNIVEKTRKKNEKHKFYLIHITTQKGEVVETLAMNPRTGHIRPVPIA